MEETDLKFYLTWLKDQLKLSVSIRTSVNLHKFRTKKAFKRMTNYILAQRHVLFIYCLAFIFDILMCVHNVGDGFRYTYDKTYSITICPHKVIEKSVPKLSPFIK